MNYWKRSKVNSPSKNSVIPSSSLSAGFMPAGVTFNFAANRYKSTALRCRNSTSKDSVCRKSWSAPGAQEASLMKCLNDSGKQQANARHEGKP